MDDLRLVPFAYAGPAPALPCVPRSRGVRRGWCMPRIARILRIPRMPRMSRAPRPRALALAIGALLGSAAILGACGPAKTGDLSRATSDYAGGRYEAALAAARAAAEGATGLALDRARYLEGLALLQLERPTDAVAPLREATDANDRALAADAFVSLGTALIRARDFDAAALAYREAAARLDGAEARRAHEVAARCYDRAGLSVAAAAERALAGSGDGAAPASSSAAAPASGSATASSASPGSSTSGNPGASIAPASADGTQRAPSAPSTPVPSSPTSRIENGIEIEPVRFAVQTGAFTDRRRAEEVARSFAESARRAGLPAPRVAGRERAGTTLFVVQIGDFPSRLAAGRALATLGGAGATVERALPALP